jgi:SAM-dependent methyltransferase
MITTSRDPACATPPPCLYCCGDSYGPLFDQVQDRLRYVPGSWAFRRCQGCGSAVLVPFPREEDLPSFYPPAYSFSPEPARGTLKRWLARLEYRLFYHPMFEAQARRVLRGVGWDGRPGKTLLDVGCGTGLRLLAFRRRGFEVQGMDFQPQAVQYLQERLGIASACTDIEGLSAHFPAGAFDLITAFHLIEHLTDAAALLRHCFRLLKPGGWFVGVVPFVDSFQARLFGGRWAIVTEAPRHVTLPSQEGLRRLCARVGFDRLAVRPDSALSCAALVGLSLFPGSATQRLYGGGRLGTVLSRLCGAAATAASLPWCLAENHLLRRPGLGMIFAHKPAGAEPPGGQPAPNSR